MQDEAPSTESDAPRVRDWPIKEPFKSKRVHDSWWWERPDNRGDLGHNRPEILVRCARIFGGRVKRIRVVTHETTIVQEAVIPPVESPERACPSCANRWADSMVDCPMCGTVGSVIPPEVGDRRPTP